MGLSWAVGVTRVNPGGRWVLARSLGSLGSALEVGFIRVRWVHSGAPWESLGSFGIVAFTQVRLVGCWVHPGSSVHSCVPWVSFESFVLLGSFARPGG